jgi:hypothetical protein
VTIAMTVGMMRYSTKVNLNTWYCFNLAYYMDSYVTPLVISLSFFVTQTRLD